VHCHFLQYDRNEEKKGEEGKKQADERDAMRTKTGTKFLEKGKRKHEKTSSREAVLFVFVDDRR
jgi:hypothetical protein